MENKQFYIKYLTNRPVKVETHYFGEHQRRRPLTDIDDLIVAYFPNTPPNELSQFSLHLPDGVAIPGDTLLFIIEQPVSSFQQPLIVRSINDTITMDEHMLWPLPQAVYVNAVTTPNSSEGRTPWHRPTHLFLWAGFLQSVVDWIDDNHDQHSQRVERPVFMPRNIVREAQTLQPFIKDNLLDVSAQCFLPHSDFVTVGEIRCNGQPDHLMVRNGELVAVIEEKGKWTLSDPDIANTYDTTPTTASAVNQLYHYMRLNYRKYGILSSYENTWFVYRHQECAVCEGSPVHETLYASEGISFNAQYPTVQQCFSYFNSIVNHVKMDSPPSSKSSRGNPLSSEIQINQQAQDFDVGDFNFDTVLGEEEANQIALKVADIAKHREMLPELLNEVSVYQQLSGLQGNGIPRLVCHGFVEEVLYCVGVSVCRTMAHGFTEQQSQKLLETLNSIHEAGILHNDIKKENILIDEFENPYIIDFGFATRSCSAVAQLEERKLLLSVVESS